MRVSGAACLVVRLDVEHDGRDHGHGLLPCDGADVRVHLHELVERLQQFSSKRTSRYESREKRER